MRTRIALVAIIPIALITVSTLTQAALAPSARAATASPANGVKTTPVALPSSTLTAYRGLPTIDPVLTGRSLLLDVNGVLLLDALLHPAPPPATAPAPAPAPVAASAPAPVPAGPVDTVTPEQRAAWERVALCEEGGDWSADGGRFSGGLGITRANWSAYGGGAYAPEGAMATEDQQIMVAERIQPSAPDQYGCHGW
jgi:hypothetical protein